MQHGVFTISLDFELYWGVRDKRSIEQYQESLLGVRNAVPKILDLFQQNQVHATWATVGFLFLKNANDLRCSLPTKQPKYIKTVLSPLKYIQQHDDLAYEYHFAPDLLDEIQACEGQEIGTHTFSHYYCLEKGQTVDDFREDLLAAVTLAKLRGMKLNSLVFPRNQWNPEYLSVLKELDIQSYRGNEQNWLYKASENEDQSKIQRALRLIDSYFNITGHHVYSLAECTQKQPFNFASSRFLRPYSSKLAFFDGLRLRRIKKSMSNAAKHHKIFHLWWHPHNFGTNTVENLDFLHEIVLHYLKLQEKHGMKSMNLEELSAAGIMAHGMKEHSDE